MTARKKPVEKTLVSERKKIIGKTIRKLRLASKMTKYEFGRLTTLNYQQIDSIEAGDYAYTVDVLLRISEVLEFDIVGIFIDFAKEK